MGQSRADMRVAIVTLGCKLNQSESAFIEGELRARGYEIVDYRDNPDVCIVNTCAVTARGDQQSRQLIRRAVNQRAKVIATGCYAQLRPHELSCIKGVIYVTGNTGKNHIIDRLRMIEDFDNISKVDVCTPDAPVRTGEYYSDRARAFLKIQDGCDHSCSYCTVPMARGKSRSLKTDDVLKAAEKLWSKGYKEIVLTGVHIGVYGHDLDPPSSLASLIRKIKRLYPDIRIRLSSIEPHEFSDDLLSLIEEELVCPHLHIPLQSGSDRILSLMNRRYNSIFYRDIINRIISVNPDISIGTDVIAGFPGEGEKEFQETISLIEDLPFSYVHVFQYSERPGTYATFLPGHLDPCTRKKRARVIGEISLNKKRHYISRYSGKILDVIIEESSKTNGFLRAISDNYIRVLVERDGIKPRSRILVRAVSALDNELICKPLTCTQK
jgi:threonylcarbamoyladenosine tRNA methylthiotransferase MtaB